MKPENVRCPVCDGPMVPRKSQYGVFWGCAKFPKCRGTRNADGEAKPRSDDSEDALPSSRQRGNDRSRWRGPS